MSVIQINYKSGQSVTMTDSEFTVKRSNLGVEMVWERGPKEKMHALYLNADEVESVWEVLK